MNISIKELNDLSTEEAQHRCFERMIDACMIQGNPEKALMYMKQELLLTQTGESL